MRKELKLGLGVIVVCLMAITYFSSEAQQPIDPDNVCEFNGDTCVKAVQGCVCEKD